MRVELKEYVRRVEFYDLEIDEKYITHLNNHIRTLYPTLVFSDITEGDIAICLEYQERQYPHLAQEVESDWSLGEVIRDYILDDLWNNWYDGEHIETEDYEWEVQR